VPRTKLTRHQLKEQDEITTSLQRVTDMVVARQKEVMIGLLALAVILIGVLGWRYYSSSRNAAAQVQLGEAIRIYNDTTNIKSDKERYERTIAEAQKTYDQYKSLPAGSIAQYYIGLSQDGLGETAKAVETLQQIVQSGDASAKPVAHFAIGAIYKKHGDNQKAIEVFKQLYEKGEYSKAAAAFELATVYEAEKQVDQAKEFYQKVITDYPESPFRASADEGLKRLGCAPAPPPSQKPS
jgi:tetratricopeptide (TPR) repeat protein